MKLTVVQFKFEGKDEEGFPPLVYEWHLNKEQCTKLAKQLGDCYPSMALVKCDESDGASYYCNYSNDENPPRNADWTIKEENQAHMELKFYHTTLRQ